MTPAAGVLVLGRGHISHKVKLHYSFKHFLLYSQALIRQSKYVVMMTKEGFTEIINMTPGPEFIQMSRTTLNIGFCDSMSIFTFVEYPCVEYSFGNSIIGTHFQIISE